MVDQNLPNVVYIVADDLGYGDAACSNPDAKMRFTDAHAGSSVCTPSRYHLLPGRYAWRSRLKRGIIWEWDESLIEPGRPTVASFLRDHGYRTSCIGKWHLGWDWPSHDGRHPNETIEFGRYGGRRVGFGEQVDFTGRIPGGPVDRGFDSYFRVDVSLSPPYAWFDDDRLAEQPTEDKLEGVPGRPGPAIPGWSHEAMLPEFTRHAVAQIEEAARQGVPFFLYMPLTSPHTPIVPNEPFRGMSGIGRYRDFVCETDWVVGQVIDALDRTGMAATTVLVFASDHGPEGWTPEDEGACERVTTQGHCSMGSLRGIKRDTWEGGHRVPLLVAWPGTVLPGSVCDQIVSLGDFFATCADILETSPTPGAAEDSISVLPLLQGRDVPTRTCVVHHSMSGTFAIRQGEWGYIDALSGDDNTESEDFRQLRGYTTHDDPGELFNLAEDLAQHDNRYNDEPKKVELLRNLLAAVKADPAIQRRKAVALSSPRPQSATVGITQRPARVPVRESLQ